MRSQKNNIAPAIVANIATTRSRSAQPASRPTILAVDDNRTQLEWLSAVIGKWGCQTLHASSGVEALAILEQGTNIDLIVLDREMPNMNGVELLRRMQADTNISSIPVIMLTGNSESESLQEEINAGVFYHLLKPANADLLRCAVTAALRERKQRRLLLAELNHHNSALRLINSCTLSVQNLVEAENAACLLAQCFPEPIKAVSGLMELLINAIEHGNLGISYEEKTILLAENRWHLEIEKRLAVPDYAARRVQVAYQRKADSWVVQITDEGAGFNWRKYWNVDPNHATSNHGRGIPRARLLAFDKLSYNEKGNQVTVSVSAAEKSNLKW